MRKLFPILLIVSLFFASCSSNNDNQDPQTEKLTLTFENIDLKYFAGPTSYGKNLYSDYEPQITGYHDSLTDIEMNIIANDGVYDFWNGGVAISQWKDITTAEYTNQCSAYYQDKSTGFGGNNGTKTFAIVFAAGSENKAKIGFKATSVKAIFNHFYICNSTFTALTMLNGNPFAKKYSYEDQDWLLLTIIGKDNAGVTTGEVKHYLSDFRTASSSGVMKDWNKVDLNSLGLVNSLEFEITGSDMGDYGLNTPKYFCLDDITFTRAAIQPL